MKKKMSIALGIMLMAVCLFVSCSKKDKQELVLYTWEGMFPQEVLDDFAKETGIKIIYSTFDTNETMLEKLSQADGGTYDLIIGDDYIVDAAIRKGLVQKLDKSRIPSFKNINPLFQSFYFDTKNEYTVPHGAGIPVIVYDPSRVDWEITGIKDLWDERLRDSVALTANYRVIEGITLMSMGRSLNENDLEVLKEVGKKLIELAPNVRLIDDSTSHLALLNGEASVAFLYTSQATAALNENPNLKVVFPAEGLGVGVMDFFIPVKAPHSDAAHKFIEYILKPDVSAQCFNFLGYYCTTKAADSLVDPILVPPSFFNGEIMQNISLEADEQQNKNWVEFKAACN
ncbi:MAG: spermidine/putrescine ABC transporter substrate-binding protein [Spirochaetales bacterium]|nr:spermidine/putrescine ABC transporter substrate-binding protein [Spirochaetales bacterium]